MQLPNGEVDNSMTSEHQDLRQSTVRGGMFVFTNTLLQKILNLGIIAIMARLLTPADYGLMGMVLALTALLGIFADMGLPSASVQKANLTFPQLSTMFWANLVLGIFLAGATAALSPLVARFYNEPILKNITIWCAFNFLVVAFGAQHCALLQRQMSFDKLAVSEITGLIVGGIVGIWMALRGEGVYALIGQQIAGTGTTALGYWAFAGWMPGLPRRGTGSRSMLALGGFLTAYNFVNHFTRNLDKILLGKFWGAGPVGLYSRGYALMLYPVTLISAPVSRVVIPALAKLQSDLPRMRVAYLRVLRIIGFICFPMMILVFMESDDIIDVVYGSKWKEAVPIFRILCIAGIWQGIYNATGQVYIASGRTDRLFKAGLVISILTASAFVAGLKWGAVGVSSAYAVAFTVTILPYLAYTYNTVGLSLPVVLRELKLPFLAAVGMLPFLWVARMMAGDYFTSWVRLLFLLVLASLLYALLMFFGCRSFLRELLHDTFGERFDHLMQIISVRFGSN
jgi:O-antigen/teichoic acid export membrane protein